MKESPGANCYNDKWCIARFGAAEVFKLRLRAKYQYYQKGSCVSATVKSMRRGVHLIFTPKTTSNAPFVIGQKGENAVSLIYQLHRCVSSFSFLGCVGFNKAVPKPYHPFCVSGNIFFVGYQYHRVSGGLYIAKYFHYLHRGF